MTQALPILYSFRRCPYAMRARLALVASGVSVELREIVLRAKPQPFLETSPSASVPCLVAADQVIDESLDVMLWALKQHDPEGWLTMPREGYDWIARNDGPFKQALDRTKYTNRYPGTDMAQERDKASVFLADLDGLIARTGTGWMFGKPTLADFAILPFVRQFAFIDKGWFDAQTWPALQSWLAAFLQSPAFEHIMEKVPVWQEGDAPRLLVETNHSTQTL